MAAPILTIAQLIKHGYISAKHYRSDILITNRIENLEPLKHACALDAITIFACMGGEVHCTVNSKPYHITKNSVLILFSGDVIKINSVTAPEGYAALMSMDYLNELDLDFSKRAAFFTNMRGHSLVRVDDDAIDLMRPYYHLGRMCIEQDCSELDQIMQGLVTAFCHTAVALVTKHLDAQPPSGGSTRSKSVFDLFISLLSLHHIQQRTVAFYAAEMGLTPKHLSHAIKEYSGRTALDWINEYVIHKSKSMLRNTTLSIKEIAGALNFSTQSAFGKYFRQQLGISPKAYRNI